MNAHLPPAEPPAEAVAELIDKLHHLGAELTEAESVTRRLLADLDDPYLPGWARERLRVEVAVARRRVELYVLVLAELQRRAADLGVPL